jgi:predicted PurR-regulated permease PerM
MSHSARISFAIVVVLMILVAYLHLGTLLFTSLLAYLILQMFSFCRSKVLSVMLYLVVVAVSGAGLVYFSTLGYSILPKIAETSIPAMVGFAEKNGIDLPFADYASLKSAALDEAREGFAVVGKYAGVASFQFVLVIAGLVIAVSVFLGSGWTANNSASIGPDNLYSAVTRELSIRATRLFESFARVMSAQIIISLVNTGLTAAFLMLNGYPHAGLLAAFVFLCGLMPIVGNIVSNTMIVLVGFTISPRTGVWALVFLIAIHKLEYFLNSKIVGKRINSPMWLTLIGLVVGERLMGIPGMILAPAVLHYIKVEASEYRDVASKASFRAIDPSCANPAAVDSGVKGKLSQY